MHQLISLSRVYWQQRWFRNSLISAMVFGLVLLMLPLLIQWGLGQLLQKQGASDVSIADIDFNPFAGTILLEQLEASGSDGPPAKIDSLSVNLSMLDLLRSRVVLQEVYLSGVSANIERADDGHIDVNGIPVYPRSTTEATTATEQTSDPIAFGVNQLDLKNLQLTYLETDFEQQVHVQSLALKNLQSWAPEQTADLDVDMQWNQSPLALTSELALFTETMQINGSLSLQALSFAPFAKYSRAHIERFEGELSLDSSFELAIGEQFSATFEHDIHINDLELDYQQLTHRSKSLQLTGQGRYAGLTDLKLTGDLQIADSQTIDREQDYLLQAFKQLTIAGFAQNPQSIAFDRFTIDQLSLLDRVEEKAFAELKQLELNELEYSVLDAFASLASVKMIQPGLDIVITKEKKLAHLTPLINTLDGLTSTGSETDQEIRTEQTSAAQPPLSLSVGKLSLVEPGNVAIIDRSVAPSYKTRIDLEKLELSNISTDEQAEFNLVLKQGEYTSININGQGLLFDPTQDLELTADIKQLDLPPVTSYTSHNIGYGMKSGTVDSRIDLKLNQREIDSLVDLKIDSIEVVETEQATAEEVTSAAGMSIDLAISTLKDKNNLIELKLPVKGNIDEPDFDLSHILRKATGQAMKTSSLAYLKHSLQPFGSLVTLYNLAKAAADQIALPAVEFAANSDALESQREELLSKVVNLLKERPGLKIKACGISTLEDQQVIESLLLEQQKKVLQEQGKPVDDIQLDETQVQAQMRELADARSATVKAYILQQGELESSRVLNCLSATDSEAGAKPSVQLLI